MGLFRFVLNAGSSPMSHVNLDKFCSLSEPLLGKGFGEIKISNGLNNIV